MKEKEKRRDETGKKSGRKRRSVDATDGSNESIKSDKYRPRIKYTDEPTAKGSDDEAERAYSTEFVRENGWSFSFRGICIAVPGVAASS